MQGIYIWHEIVSLHFPLDLVLLQRINIHRRRRIFEDVSIGMMLVHILNHSVRLYVVFEGVHELEVATEKHQDFIGTKERCITIERLKH